MEVFGSSGVRGVATAELTPELVGQLAAAAGTVWSAETVAIGRDTRTTGELFVDAASAGFAGVGAEVVELGVIPTPGAQVYAEIHDVPAAVVTASHNPPEYNGLKLITAGGVEAGPEEYDRIEECYEASAYDRAEWDAVGRREAAENARDLYVETLVDAIGAGKFADADVTVALDPGHGVGSLTSPELLQRLGCEVLTVNAQPDGHFPGRDPEPIPENLTDLKRLVRVSDADLGVAHDGDADRATFIDETGTAISGDTALAALAAATVNSGEVLVTAVNVSNRVEAAVKEAGGRVVRTPIGSARIFSEVRDLQARGERVALAGEGNGGIAFPKYRLARDGGYLAARFLGLVADRPATEVAAPHEGFHLDRRRVHHGGDPDPIMGAVERAAAEDVEAGATLETMDGYRLEYGDAWVLVRPSGTEPLVRIVAEAEDPKRAATLADRFESIAIAAGNAE